MDITILGRIGYDLYSEEPNVPLPQVRRFSRYLGGSSANMAVGLARLGAKVGILASLGNDSLSEYLIQFLKSEKVDTGHVQTGNRPRLRPSRSRAGCGDNHAPPSAALRNTSCDGNSTMKKPSGCVANFMNHSMNSSPLRCF